MSLSSKVQGLKFMQRGAASRVPDAKEPQPSPTASTSTSKVKAESSQVPQVPAAQASEEWTLRKPQSSESPSSTAPNAMSDPHWRAWAAAVPAHGRRRFGGGEGKNTVRQEQASQATSEDDAAPDTGDAGGRSQRAPTSKSSKRSGLSSSDGLGAKKKQRSR